jgi:hypothetical protein
MASGAPASRPASVSRNGYLLKLRGGWAVATAPGIMGRRVEGRPCDGNRPPLIGSGMGDLASLPDSFHASPDSSAEVLKVLSPFRGIHADTCYPVYKAHGRF